MDRRRHARHEGYFPLRFGDENSEFDALTRDLSSGGLFVQTREIYPPGTRLWLELVIEPQRPFSFEAVVVRQLAEPSRRRREGGFGLRFLSASEVLAGYLPAPEQPGPVPLSLEFETAEALRLAARRGLSNGCSFVWTAEERAVGESVALSLNLPFAGRSLDAVARVTQVISEGARFGLALAIDDQPRLTRLVGQTLGSHP